MAAAPRQTNRHHTIPSGYAYYSNTATAYAQPAYRPAEPQRQPQPQPQPPRKRPAPQPRPGYRVRPEKASALSLLQRTMLVASVLLTAATLLAVLSRYARIADEYTAVNSLKADIQQQELELAQLEVQLEFAVCLSDAKEAAKTAGMNYPTASQIVRPGELSQSALAGGGDGIEPSE